MIRAARSAVGLLTVVGGAAPPAPGAAAWFGPVGAVLGLVVGTVWLVADEVWPPALAAALVVAVDLALTGLLHADGLADAADGLLPPLERERRLQVMRTPDVGSFGVATLVVVLLVRWAALASQPSNVLLVVGLWATARASMGLALSTVPPARATGMAASFRAHSPLEPAVGAAVGVAIAGIGAGPWGLAAALAVVGVAAGVVGFARRRVGGTTGDVLGAAAILGETAGLVVAAAG